MKQMERKINITYRWWRKDHRAIKPRHVEALEESAMTRIQDQMAEGKTSGDLNDWVRMTKEDGEDGIEYFGYWEVSFQ